MKVAMIIVDAKTEEGKGISTYTAELSGAIKNYGINVNQLFYKKGSLLSFFKILPELKDYDIVHIQHEYSLFGKFAGIKFIPLIFLLSLVKKWKLVIEMHTIVDKDDKMFPNIWWWIFLKKNILYPIQNKLIGLFSDRIIVHAQYLREKLIKTYKVEKKKIQVTRLPVKTSVQKFSKESAKKKLNIKGDIYLMIGNISYLKGFDIITKQADDIGKNIVIFGQAYGDNKKYIEKIKERIKKNKFEQFVKIYVKESVPQDIKWWLNLYAADLVLLPYRTISASAILTNVMAARKPVISSNLNYFKELSSEYGCIKIAENERDYPKIIKEAMKPKNYQEMQVEANRFAKENSLKVVAKEFYQMYNKLIKI